MRFIVFLCVAFAVFESSWSYSEEEDPILWDLLDEVEQELDRRGLDDPSYTTPTPPGDEDGNGNGDDTSKEDNDDDDKDDDDDDENRIEPELIHRIRGSCGVVAAYGTHLFSDFPEGPVMDFMETLTAKNFTKEVKMFVNILKLSSKDKTVYVRGWVDSVGAKILRYRMQCPALKLQQLMLYMLRKGLTREMRRDGDSLFSKLRVILEPIVGSKAEDYAHKSVKFTYGFLWDEVIDNIMETELRDMKMLTKKLRRVAMRKMEMSDTPLPFKKWMGVLKFLFRKYNDTFTCPTSKEVLSFHVGQAQKFKERFQDDVLEKEVIVAVEELIKEHFTFPPGSNPQPTIDQMLDVFRSYVRTVLHYYNRFEERIKTETVDQMEPEFAHVLNGEQMQFFRELMKWLYPGRPPATTP